VDLKTYRIGPEDVLQIKVWQEPQLSGIVQVRPDGVITPDLIGEVQVNGMTPEQLRERLVAEYSKLVNNPLVNVSVQAVRSKKYFVSGQGVLKNGEFPLVVPTTVMEALVKAGPFTEWANKKKIIIMRGDKRHFFNYEDYVNKAKKPETNIFLENGDLVIVN
jgi:polysaccharide export outer membrane protein